MKTKLFIYLSLFITITLSGCLKKGDDDPLISLRSRKGRVDGEWKVVSSRYTSTYTSSNNPSSNYSDVYTSNENTYTLVSTDNGISTSNSGTQSEEWEFDKDGSYELSTVLNGIQTTSKGRWNFTSGIGEIKSKSQITFSEESSTSASGQSIYTGSYINDVYEIKELRHKKMVWYYHRTEKDVDGYTDTEYEVELEAEED